MTFIPQDISALSFLAVIPQSRTNGRRNEPCEFAYAESPIVTDMEITDSRLHNAPHSVSRVQSGFRNDYLFLLFTLNEFV